MGVMGATLLAATIAMDTTLPIKSSVSSPRTR